MTNSYKEKTLDNSQKELRALIADDDAGIRLTLGALMEKKGYSVTAVGNGSEAIDAFSVEEFDMILLDIRMPVMDGFEACKIIRGLENGRNIPILMLTGQDDADSIQMAFEVGATDFVAKPINFVLMSFRINYIARAANVAAELRNAERRSSNAQRIANLGHIEWDINRKIVHCSEGIREILMLPEQAPFNCFEHFIDNVFPDDKDRVQSAMTRSLLHGTALNLEHRMVRADGSVRFVMQISEYRPDKKKSDRMVVTMQDITDRIDTENRMHALAYYDDLTGLPNRSLLNQQLSQLLKGAARYRSIIAVIVFSIDNLHSILESLDHDYAEKLIVMIADRLRKACRDSDLLSRYQSENRAEENTLCPKLTAKLRNDEYVIVLSEINGPQAASVFLKRLMESFAKSFLLENRNIHVTCSAGISLAPIDSDSPNELIKYAEIAKGFANKESFGSYWYFRQELNDQVNRKFALGSDLRNALKEEALEVHYQPKINLREGKLIGVEALCRWRHPEFGAISPEEFIEIAEDEGFIGELGNWVIKTACNQLLEWQSEFNREFSVSINVSPKQLTNRSTMDHIVEFITKSPIDNALVELELTESTLMANFESSVEILNRFVEMGCKLAIDDFGTGYSSLSYLGRLPAKTLKIDKSFVTSIESNSHYSSIVSVIIKLAHSLGMNVVAEGVETESQKAILAEESCDLIQGGLISLPLSREDFADWLIAYESRRMNVNSSSETGELVPQCL